MSLEERALLKAFDVDPNLKRLEILLTEFNIFETLWGKVRRELRHSDFLTFLLDPTQNHGLGDIFLRKFLMHVLVDANNPPLSAEQIDIANLQGAIVEREQFDIDILIHDQTNRLACAIENKIDAVERPGQLDKYWQVVQQEFPNYQTIFIYLTPEGREPIDDSHNAYIPFNYDSIAELVDSLCQTEEFTTKSEPQILITHYVKMLRRHIVSNSEITKLCHKIYYEHKRALDLIFEHGGHLQLDLLETLKSFVMQSKDLVLSPEYDFVFYDTGWDGLLSQFEAKGWPENTKTPLYFEFNYNNSNELWLPLRIDSNYGSPLIHQAIYQFARSHPKVFRGADGQLSKQTIIYKKWFLMPSDYKDVDFEILMEKVQVAWNEFLGQDLLVIRQALSEIKWPSPPTLAEV